MSVATPTVLPRPPIFPTLLPRPPQPHPVPVPRDGRESGRLNLRRDWARDMDDLSDEEAELEDVTNEIKNRGYAFLIPIGKTFTQHEEKNDADEGSEADESERGSISPVATDEPEEEEEEEEEEEAEEDGEDLDADMEDLDEEPGDTTEDIEEGITGEF
ncbi:hypothetical protein K488DRAFT_86069 [Vararia minispora EC-137]|uniref:Uncharacterized protein n=1 Tax=Vararia minispora EC-137 TaxID=1314806 RepID=A0ACB8QK33_9AGAM|nr:hypothetical protein K488DRAFT_86069 [Vararia minispora EC-137]